MGKMLHGIAVEFYRGIGHDTQFISPFSRINFFIGANNAGKSIILNFLATHLHGQQRGKLDMVEVHRGPKEGTFRFGIGFNDSDVLRLCMDRLSSHNANGRFFSSKLETLQTCQYLVKELSDASGVFWIDSESQKLFSDQGSLERLSQLRISFEGLWYAFKGVSGGSREMQIQGAISAIIETVRFDFPKVHIVPAKRQMGPKGEGFTDLSGKGLIDHLALLQSPDFHQRDARTLFDKINQFLIEITGKPDAQLEVPSERQHLLVHMDGKVLPLSALGTGIHEVVLIAAFCTINDGSILCIEEPEIHLHPSLQRKLIYYLERNTSSQYFIATHSAAFIDFPNASVFHVWNDGKQTYVRNAVSSGQQRSIIEELGFKASDLLQTNCIIWVEGPSDRVYLRYWISAIDPSLVEGVHYTIMFYGGALIAHLSGSEEALDSFIGLRSINQNMAIVIDSDRSSEGDKLKPHTARIEYEMTKDGGIVWITSGREVENYVHPKVLHEALQKVHSRTYSRKYKVGKYDNSFYFYQKNEDSSETLNKKADKVAVASHVCSGIPNLEMMDLRKRIAEIVAMIRRANAMQPAPAISGEGQKS